MRKRKVTQSRFCQINSHPWLGLLLTSGETNIFAAKCAVTLVSEEASHFLNVVVHYISKEHLPQ